MTMIHSRVFNCLSTLATKLPKTATNCCRKRQQIVAGNGNKVAVSGNFVAVFGDYSFGNNLLLFSATLLPDVDRP